MILSQLVDAEELKSLSPEELRNMLAKLDDEVIYGSGEAEGGQEQTGAAEDHV
jgi:hypothetical protein